MAYYGKRRNSVDKSYLAAGAMILLGIAAIVIVLSIFKAQDEKKAQQGSENEPAHTVVTTAPEYEDVTDPVPAPPGDEEQETQETPDEQAEQGSSDEQAAPGSEEQPVPTTELTTQSTTQTTAETKKTDAKKFDASLKDAKKTKSAMKSMMKSADYQFASQALSSGSCVSAELDKPSAMSKFQYLIQGEGECILLCGNDGSVAAAVCDFDQVRYYANTSTLKKSVPDCIKDYFTLAYPDAEFKKCN